MQTLTENDAKYGFGRLINLARAQPVAKHGRPVVVVMAVEEYERLKVLDEIGTPSGKGEQALSWACGFLNNAQDATNSHSSASDN